MVRRGFLNLILFLAVNRLDFDSEIIMPSLVMWSAIPTIMMSLFIASLPDNFIGFTSAFIVLACVHILGLLFYRSETNSKCRSSDKPCKQ